MSAFSVLLLGFVTGFSVDIFTGTLGLHTSAMLLTAYLRNFMFKILNQGLVTMIPLILLCKNMGLIGLYLILDRYY